MAHIIRSRPGTLAAVAFCLVAPSGTRSFADAVPSNADTDAARATIQSATGPKARHAKAAHTPKGFSPAAHQQAATQGEAGDNGDAAPLRPAAVHAKVQAQGLKPAADSGHRSFLTTVKDFFKKQTDNMPWLPSFGSKPKAATATAAAARAATPPAKFRAGQVLNNKSHRAKSSSPVALAQVVPEGPAPVPAPEPSTVLVLGLGAVGLAWKAARRGRRPGGVC